MENEKDKNIDFEDEGYELDSVVLTLDNGDELECEVLDFFNYKGQDYIFLLPMEEDEEAEPSIYPYKYIDIDDTDSFELELVEDDMIDELMEEFYQRNEEEEE